MLGVTLGHQANSHPGTGVPWGATVQGLLQCHGRLWHGGDPGRVSVPPHPLDVPLDGLRELFWPSREAPG